MALAAFRSYDQSSDFTFSSSSAVGDLPAGTAADDGLIALVFAYALAPASPATVTSPPSGWALLGSSETLSLTGVNARASIYTKLAGGSEPPTYAWGLSAANGWQVQIMAVEHVRATSAFAQIKSALTVGSGASAVLPSVTTDETHQYLLAIVGAEGSVTFTAPGGMAEQVDTGSNFVGDEQIAAPGATGTRSITISASTTWAGWLLALYSEDSAPPSSGNRRRRVLLAS